MTRRSWRYLLILLTIWLLILAYMGWNLLVLVEDSNKNQAALDRKDRHVDLLNTQNQRLKQMVSELESQKESLESQILSKEKKIQTLKRFSDKKPQVIHEKYRRRAENEVREIFYYLSAEITKINKKIPQAKKQLTHMLKMSETLHQMLTNDLEKMNSLDGKSKWQWSEHEELSRIVQERIKKLQNPKDCSTSKKLICQLNKGCGYGCQVHHVLYCFIVAFGSQRTMIIDSTGWRYSSSGWSGIFLQPSETCTSYTGGFSNWQRNNDAQNVILPIVDSLYPRPPYMPMAVPEDLADRLSRLHGHPFVWWIGQFAKYLFRYNANVQKEINEKRERMGFKSPIVGIQVRRTDKINTEAARHEVEEYMYWVQLYYSRLGLNQAIDSKRVYVASDDPSVFPELQRKYPDYTFISDQDISKSAGIASRYSDASLHGVIFDIQMLSECDYLVCTFSSQVCRVGYEIMQSKHPDASRKFQSLDDIYYFGGQSGHNVRAILPHTAETREEIDLEVGDLIGIAGNHWDGYSKGTNHRTGQMGLYPSYKVEEVMETAQFPTFDDL
ncbi:predicted protein [Nematostella vectensis]|uniref:Alpha-(1,6)-fucosyltransferase n=1 Tax=Nematostella vectensis TaxID=45351 RepID=A7RY92_NEMVE|nr:predicted protein [Nematostella vectensis]|eukprot:XP_001635658.1 predicted protein [Nematostella vectensis]